MSFANVLSPVQLCALLPSGAVSGLLGAFYGHTVKGHRSDGRNSGALVAGGQGRPSESGGFDSAGASAAQTTDTVALWLACQSQESAAATRT